MPNAARSTCCGVPLGVMKAVRHGSKFDVLSSVVVFIGYAIPGWALGTVLLVLLGGGSFWSVFPLGGQPVASSLGETLCLQYTS